MGGGFAYGDLGMTHHATEDIAMMRALPNMSVFVPYTQIAASTTVNAGIGNLHLFPTLLLQNNLKCI